MATMHYNNKCFVCQECCSQCDVLLRWLEVQNACGIYVFSFIEILLGLMENSPMCNNGVSKNLTQDEE